jgi:hypothetical protein
MSWKRILPEGIAVKDLSLDDCRNFKKFYELMESLKNDVKGPVGYRLFYEFMHHLLFYAACCIEEKKFPVLNKCWDTLSPLFLTPDYDNEWLVFCWMFCDFPLNEETNEVLLDHFMQFLSDKTDLPSGFHDHLRQFHTIMKSSRLGLYQEILSTSKTTKYRELFTNNVISTVRSVPYYESGEIFLTRIISYLGDSFAIHDARCYPSSYKKYVEDMARNKMHFISSTSNEVTDYERFMKLAGPYWMSCTHTNQAVSILNPDEYKFYYYN